MKAISVAKWFVDRANSEYVDVGLPEGVTNLKLQKLLYFSQAVSLSLRDKVMFDDPIEAWKFGPVVPTVYHALKENKNNIITAFPSVETEKIDGETAAILEDVWNVYGKFAAHELVSMTHDLKPWKDAFLGTEKASAEITVESLRSYYSGFYVKA